MSVFTEKELEYFAGQRLGRIATVGPDGQPHVVPTSFRYSPDPPPAHHLVRDQPRRADRERPVDQPRLKPAAADSAE